jgi:hypothetical protein
MHRNDRTTMPVSSSFRRRSASPSSIDPPHLSLGQAHRQHHIIAWKLPDHFPAALLPSGHRNADDILRTSAVRPCSSSLRRLGPSPP